MLIKTPYIKYFHTKHWCCESLIGGRHGPQKPRQEGSAGYLEPGGKNHEKTVKAEKKHKGYPLWNYPVILGERLGSAGMIRIFWVLKWGAVQNPFQMLQNHRVVSLILISAGLPWPGQGGKMLLRSLEALEKQWCKKEISKEICQETSKMIDCWIIDQTWIFLW